MTYTQFIPAPIEEVWSFFSNPANLKKITPPDMQFTIVSRPETTELFEGMRISYRLAPLLNLPVGWVTRITSVDKPVMFEDEQVEGPYEYWHHKHTFTAVEGGVRMTDRISYRLPYGAVGEMIDTLVIHRRLEEVFAYRRRRISELFGIGQEV
ncbi:SRPBCC family protein [Prosthecochloris sp. HL-130-GSB]|uniref:SRPBCC family protein n=1 Tax=Prosthecochloris sp. HL-130-GSB TaxID=1974213 RepID=UPI001E437C2A|nr:SRPBCC family protein [Prosthecochloris sp. HL-130-GSB]